MAQQLAIIVLVDIGGALRDRTLDDNVYVFDNMRFQGSTGEGTGDLVTAVNGSYWSDGSQGTEQVLNWLPYALGGIPPTVPRGYAAERSRQIDQQALDDLRALADGADDEAAGGVNRIRRDIGTRVRSTRGARGLTSRKVLDVTGRPVSGADAAAAHNYATPIITDITGEAVDEKIIYPAEYGSPDMVTDGWYWSATIDTARPGTYAYTMHVQLHELVERDAGLRWEAVDLTCEARLRVVTEPKRNAFTGGGLGLLPVYPAPPAAPAAPPA
ncbi:hypothetical protein [Actinomadura parmotrematis]|uniref:Uncharacterized protein n=1 Tax=Actinomadura parmotrematis TaxID=2864039 RepID=A0ABS7FLY7_9ACTN|nr:hypothetical protein [Actinomadura parmotrematis]MBW8481381.1 hypothetical protein [Actinomadura parmotrematis]